MGLLSEGSPLTWEETRKLADHVRKHGIEQFINLYHKYKDMVKEQLLWGDEVEYNLVSFDHDRQVAKLHLRAKDILEKLHQNQREQNGSNSTLWNPEYADYMVEGTPGKPYGGLMAHFNMVEANMKRRREEVLQFLGTNQSALTLTAFPRMGCPNFTDPEYSPTPTGGASHSLFFPDEAIFPGHPRFKTLTRNIRHRRKEKVAINVPIFKDKNTPSPFVEDFTVCGDDGEAKGAAKKDHIYMDAMGFGMGCSCLQMTFQACCLEEAVHLYDQLAPLCPILLALSAASPVYRGYLSDVDCRWNIIAQSVDDRTKEERGLEPLKENRRLIHKSRYDSIDSYLMECNQQYNDIDLVMDQDIYTKLKAEGIAEPLARHIAHLFIRDPVSLFSEKINQEDAVESDHFENIQSTNWQTMRFKPPPPGKDIGWRVEFRPLEVQLTDFENAAFVVFIVMLTRVILSFNLNLVIPISKVDENMQTAQKRDAVMNQKFYFRKDLLSGSSPPAAAKCIAKCRAQCKSQCTSAVNCDMTEDCKKETPEDEYTLMTVDEIINGKDDTNFPGIVPLLESYLSDLENVDVDTRCSIIQYLKLIRKRASGELKTTARWMRDFITNHEDYKQDSVVSERITYDLIKKCDNVTKGIEDIPELLFPFDTRTSDDIPTSVRKEAEKMMMPK